MNGNGHWPGGLCELRSQSSLSKIFTSIHLNQERIKHNEPHRLSNQKNFVYQAEIGH